MDHLSRLKYNRDEKRSGQDGGLSNVLQSFARSLGYTVTNKHPSKSDARAGVSGEIIYEDKIIYLKPTRSKVNKARVLAHELAHHYDFEFRRGNLRDIDQSETEQIAEAVSACFLLDYGVNVISEAQKYIASWSPLVDEVTFFWRIMNGVPLTGFKEGMLDKKIKIVYSALSCEFEEFLKGD